MLSFSCTEYHRNTSLFKWSMLDFRHWALLGSLVRAKYFLSACRNSSGFTRPGTRISWWMIIHMKCYRPMYVGTEYIQDENKSTIFFFTHTLSFGERIKHEQQKWHKKYHLLDLCQQSHTETFRKQSNLFPKMRLELTIMDLTPNKPMRGAKSFFIITSCKTGFDY